MTEITRRGLMTPSCWRVIPLRGIFAKKNQILFFRAEVTWKNLRMRLRRVAQENNFCVQKVSKWNRMPRSVDELAAHDRCRIDSLRIVWVERAFAPFDGSSGLKTPNYSMC
jgi:hypothetical protein